MRRDSMPARVAQVVAAGLLVAVLSGCLRTSTRTGAAAAEKERRLLPAEQGAQRATFALG